MARSRMSAYSALLHPARALGAAFWFAVAAVGMTWPLALGMTRDMPWDLGDPLLNCWIVGWTAERLVRFLAGDPSALLGLWDGNIFHPEPLTLAYSELLYAQVLQALPVYAATKNLILTYNLLFLSTFALSALGAYLFVREITGDWRAALIAGLAFGFAPNRAAQAPHLQVLSSQWMPFALYGFRRYLDTGTRRALAGATAAVVLQNWSCGYHLLFFSLLLPAYLVWELYARQRLRDWHAWRGIFASALAVVLATIPVLWPYLALRRIQPGFKRAMSEIEFYSADVYSYLTASPHLKVWGSFQTFTRAEGELFPGSAVIALSLIAVGAALVAGVRRTRSEDPPPGASPATSVFRGVLGWSSLLLVGVSVAGLAWVVTTGGQLPEDRLARARREIILQQQVDKATQFAVSRGYQPGPYRGAMEGFPWDKFDPLHRDRSIKMVCARVFEHIDPGDADAIDRAAAMLKADGVRVEREGIDRLRFSDDSVIDVLRGATATRVPGAITTWNWLVVERPPVVIAPWLLAGLFGGGLMALVCVPAWRQRAVQALRSPAVFFLLVAIAAAWLSLGPLPRSRGILIGGLGLYDLVVGYLPGFDGLRVVARLAILVFLSLSVLAGIGAAAVLRRYPRAAPLLTVLGVAWVLADGFAAPIPRNENWTDEGLAYPPRREASFSQAPAVYQTLRELPDGSALIEFPFGVIPWEIRYVYRSTFHWRPIANGFSGWTPPSYRRRLGVLRQPLDDPDGAWDALSTSGVTHVVIHRVAYPPPPKPRAGEDAAVAAWLEQHGSRLVADTGDAVVYALKQR